MVATTRVKAVIHEDNTGKNSELPIILTEQGELAPVTDYLLFLETNGKSQSLINNVIRSTQLLIDYIDINIEALSDPQKLFQTFVKRMYSGTIGHDGLDPSGLYWIPPTTRTTDRYIRALTGLTDFLAENQNVLHMNPLIKANSHEQRLNYAAWYRRNQHDFLGHIYDKSKDHTINKVRALQGRSKSTFINDDAKAFPEYIFDKFFNYGIGETKDHRVALRDKLIVLLMHYGGLRESEAMSLWIQDVYEDPFDTNQDPDITIRSLVRIYHEADGKAPDSWKSRKGSTSRQSYLKEQFGLIPRCIMKGTAYIGFKGTIYDHRDQYIQVQWFPLEAGRIFNTLWKDYLKYRSCAECHHPYAWINFETKHFGKPYKLNAFLDNYARGLRRINLQPDQSIGLNPHGHRHSYGHRLDDANIHPQIIKKCLHHKAISSQEVYKGKNQEQINSALNKATQQLSNTGANKTNQLYKLLDEHNAPYVNGNIHRDFVRKK